MKRISPGVWKLTGNPEELRGLSWLWGVPYYGLQVAWSQQRHWFIGWTTRFYKRNGW